VPLDPEEAVLVTPVLPAEEVTFRQEGSYQGRPWRPTFAPSGIVSIRAKFDVGGISVNDESPVIVTEFARSEPLDREGKKLPASPFDNSRFPMNVHGVQCPEFGAAKGHAIRIGFDEPRIVQFTIRPEIAAKE